jgi:type IV secretion system protein VirB1
MLLTAAMNALLSSCAPRVGVKTMAGIVEYESGWKPNAIGDNTTRQSYYPATQSDALAIENRLLGLGHNIDVGLGQVNSANFAAYGVTPATVLDPCTNVHTGATILAGNYNDAVQTNWLRRPIVTRNDIYLQQQYALVHALSAYNTGRFFAGMGYAKNVYEIAQSVTIDFPYAPQINQVVAYTPVLHNPHPRLTTHRVKLAFRPLWVDMPTRSASELLLSNLKDQNQ